MMIFFSLLTLSTFIVINELVTGVRLDMTDGDAEGNIKSTLGY